MLLIKPKNSNFDIDVVSKNFVESGVEIDLLVALGNGTFSTMVANYRLEKLEEIKNVFEGSQTFNFTFEIFSNPTIGPFGPVQ
jgi:hypothetical protein